MSIKTIRNIIKSLPSSDKLYVGDFPNYASHKIGIDPEEKYLTLLIHGENPNNFTYMPGGGKYLTIQYDARCLIFDSNNVQKEKNFTILRLRSTERDIEDYFLEMCTILIHRLGNKPLLEDIKGEIEKIESLFLKLSKSSKSSVIGVWGELFLIDISKKPEVLIDAWHKNPNDLFDFNDGTDKIEVKTTTQKRRSHSFELSQLSNNSGAQVLVASIQTSETDLGNSLLEVILSIKSKVNVEAFEKLIQKAFDVLGDRLQESFEIRFDSTLARGTLKFFDAAIIPKPTLVPTEVSDVRFTVEMGGLEEVSITGTKCLLFQNFESYSI